MLRKFTVLVALSLALAGGATVMATPAQFLYMPLTVACFRAAAPTS